MMSFSSGSDSKTVEQAGSMISSRNAMCAGKRIKGSFKTMGRRAMPAMGTWMERM